MDDLKEVAKAASETAKFGTRALEVTEKILLFLEKVIREPVGQVSGIISDRLKFFRWQRQIRMADQVNRILNERGIGNTKAVPPKLALPIIEAASLEENDELQDLWAKLLSNAMDPNCKLDMQYSFVDILKSLSPLDVKFLKYFYDVLKNDSKIDWNNTSCYSLKKEQFVQGLSVSESDYYLTICNLFRVQCLAPAILTGGMRLGSESVTIYKGQEQIVLTVLGVRLIEAAIK